VVATFASIPTEIMDPLVSVPVYPALFDKLGFAGIACTVIALAMLPLMKKLSSSHSDSVANNPLPAVRSEEFNTPA
jgi:POT family proton-dependent oligopeptide transporter